MCIPIFTFNKSLSRYVVEIAGVTRLIVLISNLCKIDTQNGQFIVTQTHTRRQPFLEKGDPKRFTFRLADIAISVAQTEMTAKEHFHRFARMHQEHTHFPNLKTIFQVNDT